MNLGANIGKNWGPLGFQGSCSITSFVMPVNRVSTFKAPSKRNLNCNQVNFMLSLEWKYFRIIFCHSGDTYILRRKQVKFGKAFILMTDLLKTMTDLLNRF